MITQMIFDWAKQTPDKTAIIYNGKPFSYHSFAQLIAVARGYFVRRGYIGPGYAVLAVDNLMDFWIFKLALRSLGLTTVEVRVAEGVKNIGLPNIRCVVTNPPKVWPGLEGLCTELGLPLLSVGLAGEPAVGLESFEMPHPSGGHILRTSGTTGVSKMVLMSSEFDADLLRLHVELFGINQRSLLCVFDTRTWTGLAYKWAASPWSVGGATLIEQGAEPYRALLRPVNHSRDDPPCGARRHSGRARRCVPE